MFKYYAIVAFKIMLVANIVWSEGLKIAVVDLEKAIGDAEAVKAIASKLDAEFAGERKELKSFKEKIAELEEKQKQEAETNDQETADKVESELRRKRIQYSYFYEAVSEKADQRHEELMEKINPLIQQAIKKTIESGNFDIVYQQENLLHFDPKFDISAKLTQKINQLVSEKPE